MKNPNANRNFNRIVQAFPMMVFSIFTIYFFVNGNVGFCRTCKGLESLGTEILLMALVGGTIIIYTLVYFFSLFFYSPKFNYAAAFFLFVFILGTLNLEIRPSKAEVRKMTIEMHQANIESLDTQIKENPNNYRLIKKKSSALTQLGYLNSDSTFYISAIQELENFQKRNSNYPRINKEISDLYNKLAWQTKNYQYNLSAIDVIKKENTIRPDSFYSYKDCGSIYEKIYDLTNNTNYLYQAIKEYESMESIFHSKIETKYRTIGKVYEKLEDYPKAIEAYNNALSKSNNKSYLLKKIETLKAKV